MATNINMTEAELIYKIQHNTSFRKVVNDSYRDWNDYVWRQHCNKIKRVAMIPTRIKEAEDQIREITEQLRVVQDEKKPWVNRDPKVWDEFKAKLGDDELFGKLKATRWAPLSKLEGAPYYIRLCNRERSLYGKYRSQYYQFDILNEWQRHHDAKIQELQQQLKDSESRLESLKQELATPIDDIKDIKWSKPDYAVQWNSDTVIEILSEMGLLSCDSVVKWEYTTHLASDVIETTHEIRLIDTTITVVTREDYYEDDDEEEEENE